MATGQLLGQPIQCQFHKYQPFSFTFLWQLISRDDQPSNYHSITDDPSSHVSCIVTGTMKMTHTHTYANTLTGAGMIQQSDRRKNIQSYYDINYQKQIYSNQSLVAGTKQPNRIVIEIYYVRKKKPHTLENM